MYSITEDTSEKKKQTNKRKASKVNRVLQYIIIVSSINSHKLYS